jgi:GTP-binding protein HflX
MFDTRKKQERAILIGVVSGQQKTEQAEEYLDELSFLCLTAGAKVIGRFLQRMPYPNPRTFIGEGKLTEIAEYIQTHQVDIAVFDDELSPSQLRNIEQKLKCKILDRNNLILDIFANRARTAQAKYQVELAQAQYLLPRLTRMWTHLSKQKGGIGMKGPGETEIETDRRALRNKIDKLKERLALIEKQNTTRRKNRDGITRIALVGYTNVGKSSLLNALTKSDVLAENKLFATLDATVRKVVIDTTPILLTDTVGFIRKLPHQLIESFKSTLDEIKEADVLLHVVDVSHPDFEQQIDTVNATLTEIGCLNKPIIMVFNKIDLLHLQQDDDGKPQSMEAIQEMWMGKMNAPAVFISTLNKTNMAELRKMLKTKVLELNKQKAKPAM